MNAMPAGRGRAGRVLFVLLMAALTVLFAGLGTWQIQRLAEKEALIAAVADRLDNPPQSLPPSRDWPTLDPAAYDYLPLTLEGRFLPGSTALVFTSLSDPRGKFGGPGYWVMSLFELTQGGTVFLNRGFVPQGQAEDLSRFEPANPASGNLTLTGIARRPEATSPFTPAPDAAGRIDWVRDPQRLADLVGSTESVAPLYLDLPAGASGELPQGGETIVEFPNNHLGYALTWFGFAVLTPILTALWLRRSHSATSGRVPRANRSDGSST